VVNHGAAESVVTEARHLLEEGTLEGSALLLTSALLTSRPLRTDSLTQGAFAIFKSYISFSTYLC